MQDVAYIMTDDIYQHPTACNPVMDTPYTILKVLGEFDRAVKMDAWDHHILSEKRIRKPVITFKSLRLMRNRNATGNLDHVIGMG